MAHRIAHPDDPGPRPKRRRPPRPLSLLGAVPDDLTAEAIDDEHAAKQLITELLALVEAGRIELIEQDGVIRYAAIDPDAET